MSFPPSPLKAYESKRESNPLAKECQARVPPLIAQRSGTYCVGGSKPSGRAAVHHQRTDAAN